MSEMEEKLSAILSNPQAMQQIMSMAQALGQSQTSQQAAPPPPQKQSQPQQRQSQSTPAQLPTFSEGDLAMIQKLSSLAGRSNIDRDQQALLKALGPYLSRDRISKLEKAMRAARIAKFASIALNQGQATARVRR